MEHLIFKLPSDSHQVVLVTINAIFLSIKKKLSHATMPSPFISWNPFLKNTFDIIVTASTIDTGIPKMNAFRILSNKHNGFL